MGIFSEVAGTDERGRNKVNIYNEFATDSGYPLTHVALTCLPEENERRLRSEDRQMSDAYKLLDPDVLKESVQNSRLGLSRIVRQTAMIILQRSHEEVFTRSIRKASHRSRPPFRS